MLVHINLVSPQCFHSSLYIFPLALTIIYCNYLLYVGDLREETITYSSLHLLAQYLAYSKYAKNIGQENEHGCFVI